MKYKTIPILIFVFCSGYSLKTVSSQNLHDWKSARLEWGDFKGRVLNDTMEDYSFNPIIEYYTYNDQLLFNPRLKTNLLLNRNTTWIRNKFKDRETLYFFQTYYDLTELYRRLIEQRMKSTPIPRNLFDHNDYQHKLEKIYDYTLDEFEHELKVLYEESNTGGIPEVTQKWSEEIWNRMDTLLIPETVARNNTWGIEFLMGPSISFSDLDNVFRGGFNLDLSVYYQYKRLYLLAGLELISNDTRREEYFNQDLPKNTNLNFTYFNVEGGVKFMDNAWVQVVPFTGFYLGELYLTTAEKDEEGYDNYSRFVGNFQAGLAIDYKILSAKRRKDPLYHGSYFGIRLKGKYLPVSFDDYKGGKLNISIGLIVQGRGIEYKRR